MKAIAKDHSSDGLKFTDVAMLEPKKRDMKMFGVLSNHDVVGNMYIITKKKLQEINISVNTAIKAIPKVDAGATILPSNSGVGIRMLGSTASDLRSAIYEVVRIVRRIILDAPFSGIRKG
jgi:urease accessory protein